MDYAQLASNASIQKAITALRERRFDPIIVEDGAEALTRIKESIPRGASVMNGSSVSLEQIGFVEYLNSGDHGWSNSHAEIVAENDAKKRAELRRRAVNSDFYLGSVHAIAETGEVVIGSNTGSQLPHLAFTSPNLILVVGTQKLVPTLQDAIQRLHEHVMPLEDAHMKQLYGPGSGTVLNKTLILHGENAMLKRSVRVLLVKEKLGF